MTSSLKFVSREGLVTWSSSEELDTPPIIGLKKLSRTPIDILKAKCKSTDAVSPKYSLGGSPQTFIQKIEKEIELKLNQIMTVNKERRFPYNVETYFRQNPNQSRNRMENRVLHYAGFNQNSVDLWTETEDSDISFSCNTSPLWTNPAATSNSLDPDSLNPHFFSFTNLSVSFDSPNGPSPVLPVSSRSYNRRSLHSSDEEYSPILPDVSRPPPRLFCDFTNLFSLRGQITEMSRGPRGSIFLVERIRRSSEAERKFLMSELGLPRSLSSFLKNSYCKEVLKALVMKDGIIRNELISEGKTLDIDIFQQF